jgi:hypothetical protein
LANLPTAILAELNQRILSHLDSIENNFLCSWGKYRRIMPANSSKGEPMIHIYSCITYRVLIAASVFCWPLSSHAAQRTFVSGSGNDVTATCTFSDPCRGFARALSFTDPNGEVIVKDSAGYGAVTITQSVSIIAPPGVYAGISVFSGNGVDINGAGLRVVLKGLSINGQGGNVGILFTGSGILHIENCTVSNMNSEGLFWNAAQSSEIYVKDSVFRDNDDEGAQVAGLITGSVDRSRFESNGFSGLAVSATAVSVRDSVAVGNGQNGFAGGSTSGNVSLSIDNSVASNNTQNGISASWAGGTLNVAANGNTVSNNGSGIAANGAGATLTASRNIVTRNATGLSQSSSAAFHSLGDNAVNNNTANVSGTITPLTGQ